MKWCSLQNLQRSIVCAAIIAVSGLLCFGIAPSPAEAQTTQYIGTTCTFSWTPNTETDLAGYRAFAVKGATQNPIVTIPKTATSTSCAALGVTSDGVWTFNVLAYDLAGNASNPSTIQATVDTKAPASPGGLNLSSPQPIAMSVTPNPGAKQATVAWVPGGCREEFIVHKLMNGKWLEIGRTADTWLDVPLSNTVNQPYGVTAVCPTNG